MRDNPKTPTHSESAVIVIGAGLAGLTAAATAARAGKTVVVVEAHTPGGRARTDGRNGFRFNQGPHALYRGGPAWRILRELNVPHRGHQPPLRGVRGTRRGELTRLVDVHLGAFVARLATMSGARWAGHSAQDWIESLRGGRDFADVARMAVRVTSYVADLERMPADLAISQLKMGLLRGVSYLDGGWASLADGLSSRAEGSGAALRTHQAAAGIGAASGTNGGWEVALADGTVLRAAAVVVATGSPAAARKLLPVDPGWTELGPPVTAACLDLGLHGVRPPLLFGIDQPLYLSRHSPPGDLAPRGGSVVHVLRYGARDARTDRADLRQHARMAGIEDHHIVEERFLASMVVNHVLPNPKSGLAGRPGVDVPGATGLYLAGDWVGPSGWLADAAMASGHRAGQLASRLEAGHRFETLAA